MTLVASEGTTAHLELLTPVHAPAAAISMLHAKVLGAIDDIGGIASRDALRATLRLRNETLGGLLAELARDGHVVRQRDGWRRVPVPSLAQDAERNANAPIVP
jgi:hypothetical protein